MNDQQIEQEIQEKGLTAPRVTPDQIQALMEQVRYHVHLIPETTTTVATAIAANGFTLAIGMAACASPENFDEDLGRKVAIDDAEKKARDALWKLEGYRLKTTLAGCSIAEIARVAHEINRAYCAALGDDSQPAWEDAPEWQKDSAMNGVNFHSDNPSAGPEASHESWMSEKELEGWVFGEVKDPEAKTHPCMVPFADLPTEQKAKDYLFRAVVHALA